MLVHAKKIVAISVAALVAVAVLLPMGSLAATSPSVSVLSPLVDGLRIPIKIALDADGNIYVSDKSIGGVVKFNASGVQQQQIFKTANRPKGLTIAQDGTLLVCQNSFVARYDTTTGQEIGRLVGGQLQTPAGVAVDDVTGYIYVADSSADQIEMYNASGEYVKAFAKGVRSGATGVYVVNPVGKLCMPSGIAFEKASRQIAVADTLNNRVQFFDVDGNFVKSIGIPLSGGTTSYGTVGPMQFVAPVAIAFEYSKDQVPVLNRIYIVDMPAHNVQVVNPGTATVPASALNIVGRTNNYIANYVFPANGFLQSPIDAVFDAKNNRLLVVNGYGNITIYGIDGGTNPLYTDTTPPVFTVNPIPAEVTVNTLTISGTVEAGSSVRVVADSSAVVGAVAYAGSLWSVVVDTLASGNNNFTVTAKDAAGNIAAPQSINVNYMLPAPSFTVSTIPALTNVGELVLSGTVDEGATVAVTNESASASGAAVVAGANWTHKVALGEGVNSIVITAQKPMSLKSTKYLNITLDSIPPALDVSALSDGSYTSNPTQNVSGNAPEATSIVVLLNNVPVAATFIDGYFTALLDPLLTGANEVSVEARDAAGNVTVDRRVLKFDATKPQIAITSPMDNSYTNTANIQITGSVDEISMVVVSGVPAVVDNDNNWSASIELVAGTNTIEVIATDLYGNASTTKRTVELDTVKPVLAITDPVQDAVTKLNSKAFTGTVDDYSAVTYSVNGKTTPVSVENGSFTFKVDFVSEGLYPVIVVATDYAGNSTTAIRTLSYDITPPLLALDDAVKWQVHANGGQVSGTVELGATVAIKGIFLKDGIETNSIAARVVGDKWSADLSGISFNQNRLSVEAMDTAGNVTEKVISNNSSAKNK